MDIYTKSKGNPYMYEIITYGDEEIKEIETVFLHKSGLETYDNEVPICLGSNQVLIEVE